MTQDKSMLMSGIDLAREMTEFSLKLRIADVVNEIAENVEDYFDLNYDNGNLHIVHKKDYRQKITPRYFDEINRVLSKATEDFIFKPYKKVEIYQAIKFALLQYLPDIGKDSLEDRLEKYKLPIGTEADIKIEELRKKVRNFSLFGKVWEVKPEIKRMDNISMRDYQQWRAMQNFGIIPPHRHIKITSIV